MRSVSYGVLLLCAGPLLAACNTTSAGELVAPVAVAPLAVPTFDDPAPAAPPDDPTITIDGEPPINAQEKIPQDVGATSFTTNPTGNFISGEGRVLINSLTVDPATNNVIDPLDLNVINEGVVSVSVDPEDDLNFAGPGAVDLTLFRNTVDLTSAFGSRDVLPLEDVDGDSIALPITLSDASGNPILQLGSAVLDANGNEVTDANGNVVFQADPNGSVLVRVDDPTQVITTEGFIQRVGVFGNDNTTAQFIPGVTTQTQFQEFRVINENTDAELQLFSLPNSTVGQVFVFRDASTNVADTRTVFFDGNATADTTIQALEAGNDTATFTGSFGGVGIAENFTSFNRLVDSPTVNDRTDNTLGGTEFNPNGTFRLVGDTNATIEFGTGAVNGTVTNIGAFRFDPGGGDIIVIPNDEPQSPFPNLAFSAQLNRVVAPPPDPTTPPDPNVTLVTSTFSGTARAPLGEFITGSGAVEGGLFGPNADEIAGIISVQATIPGPSDGVTLNDQDLRATVDIQGVIQGTRDP